MDVTQLIARIQRKEVHIGVIGLGYVGLPLARLFVDRGFRVTGFDVDPSKTDALNAGRSYIKHIPEKAVAAMLAEGRFQAVTDFALLAEVDAILICVPTPLGRHREPDMSYVAGTAETIARHLRPGHLIVLESSTWPGTTEELVKPILEDGPASQAAPDGLLSGRDFLLAYSPEREDPGNPVHETSTIPKVVGGDGADALVAARALYDHAVVATVPVTDTRTAEAIKLTENIFRAVNIALVNELKVVYEAMGIDVWEVIDAAKSKPFGFMPFYPGPGLGGHCIPIDPFYLTWKAREVEVATRFIELAGEINTAMPHFVVQRLAEALNRRQGRAMNGATVMLLGLAYKKNVDDIRESPGLRIMELLAQRGAELVFHDPHIEAIPRTREHPEFAGRRSLPLDGDSLAAVDAVLIVTDHDAVDYALVARHAALVIDTRNVMARTGLTGSNIVKA
ncbi:nucleotide sugar dehydrogenase [Marinibaculum pumilum]|uniref:Nucleotide sugar dehydrogenase n=1 Tax=Marinibaculum pumilum TaxID=1766165 RepID=A0ABV7KXT0_9PROT